VTATRCPTCRRVAAKTGTKVYPFCSERCHLVDLGRWLNEDYRVASDEPVDPNLIPQQATDDPEDKR
jgi:endogenous inhibitor of DNA gyrase (YacG/DUF329 family)